MENKTLLDIPDPLWTIDDVAKYLRFSPSTIRKLKNRGDIPYFKLGAAIRFRKSDIDLALGTRHRRRNLYRSNKCNS